MCTDKGNLQEFYFFEINTLPIQVDHETIYIDITQNITILISEGV